MEIAIFSENGVKRWYACNYSDYFAPYLPKPLSFRISISSVCAAVRSSLLSCDKTRSADLPCSRREHSSTRLLISLIIRSDSFTADINIGSPQKLDSNVTYRFLVEISCGIFNVFPSRFSSNSLQAFKMRSAVLWYRVVYRQYCGCGDSFKQY